MNLYVLKRITYFGKSPLIDTYHFTMFHGWAVRGDHPDQDVSYALGDELEFPLKLYLNIFRINDVIQPRLNLLIRDQASAGFRTLQNVELTRCTIQGVCQIPYAEGDFSHWDIPGYADDGEQPKRILLDAARPAEPGSTPAYHEVICPNLERVPGISRARKVTAAFPTLQAEIEFPATRSAFEEYPLVWHDGYFLVSEQLFRNIRSAINWNYFAYTTVVVN